MERRRVQDGWHHVRLESTVFIERLLSRNDTIGSKEYNFVLSQFGPALKRLRSGTNCLLNALRLRLVDSIEEVLRDWNSISHLLWAGRRLAGGGRRTTTALGSIRSISPY